MEQENKIKGGVIIIGSLFWENGDNAIQDAESKILAEKRKCWREQYLDLAKKKETKLPIRYGRCSSSRKCTYTMVFSNLVLGKESYGLIIPYKENIDFSNYLNFERQAQILADVEGISKDGDKRLIKDWGCIGLFANPNSPFIGKIRENWDGLRLTDDNYKQKCAKQFRFKADYDDSLLTQDYILSEECLISTDLDFLFFTYIKPEHKNKNEKRFPTEQEIAEEMLRSGYSTYFEENINSGIRTFEDETIKSYFQR